MVYRVFSASVTFFLRRVLHFKGCIIGKILVKIMRSYSDFLGRLIFRSSYACRYTESDLKTEEGMIACSDLDKADVLNTYFSRVFTEEDKTLDTFCSVVS